MANRVVEVIKRGKAGQDGDVGLTSVSEKSAAYTALKADRGVAFHCTAGMTLSFDSVVTLTNGWHCIVHADGGDVILDPDGTETINGSTTETITDGGMAIVYTDGTDMYWLPFGALNLATLGITASAAELNTLDGITATAAELNYSDGVTSNIQTQLDGKTNEAYVNAYDECFAMGAITSGTSPVLEASRGVASITWNSNGNVTVTFSVAQPDTDYNVQVTCESVAGTGRIPGYESKTVNGFVLTSTNDAGSGTNPGANFRCTRSRT